MRLPATLLAAVLACPSMLCGCQTEPAPAADRAVELRLLSYNIRHGADYDMAMNLPRQAEVIAAAGADWVALQEVDMNCRRSGSVEQAPGLARLAARGGAAWIPHFASAMDFDGGRYGVATLCRLPVVRTEELSLPGKEPRAAALDIVRVAERELALACVHLDAGGRNEDIRLEEARILIARLDALGLPAVVMGDFNAKPGSPTLAAFAAAGFQPVPKRGDPRTYDARKPSQEIDHLYIRSGRGLELAPVSAEVLPEAQASDHRPLLGVVRVKVK